MIFPRAKQHERACPNSAGRHRGTLLPYLLLALLFFGTGVLNAQVVIASHTGGTSAGSQYPAESFTTPAGGPWNNITFNFVAGDFATPAAVGTAYLLTQAYTGTPAGLSSSAAGFVAASTGVSGGKYVFAPSVTLQPNTQYFVFSDSSFVMSWDVSGTSSASFYRALTSSGVFANFPLLEANFQVSSTVVSTSVPVLSTPALISLGMLLAAAAAFLALRQRRAAV
jgi:hypothetical protein